jgi:hypothetical protein
MKKQTLGQDDKDKVPRCPNHGEPLELSLEQLTEVRGSAPCPVSKCLFEFEQIPNEKEFDKEGNPLIQIKVTGNEE